MREYPKLTEVIPIEDYRLVLTYDGVEKRLFDFKPNLNHKFYAPLSNIVMFNAVTTSDGEIEWATGQDFCPHTLYDNSQLLENLS